MCTIMTLDRKTWDNNLGLIAKQIAEDASKNFEGFSLILAGAHKGEVSVHRSMHMAPIAELLMNTTWKRFWLHCRWATTTNVGINQTHAFEGGDWHVMHNGYISHPKAQKFKVDSQLIPAIIREYGVGAAIGELLHQETFANVFLVNLYTGAYHVVRCAVGSLYTDGKGNYSTNKIDGLINLPVGQFTQTRHRLRWPSEKKKKKKKDRIAHSPNHTQADRDFIPPVNEERYWHPHSLISPTSEADLGSILPDDNFENISNKEFSELIASSESELQVEGPDDYMNSNLV